MTRYHLFAILTVTIFFLLPNVVVAESQSGVYQVNDQENIYDIPYIVTNGKLKNMAIDFDGYSLAVSIEATDSGTMMLEIPRELFPMISENCEYDDFFVLIDREEIDSVQMGTTTNTKITISFERGEHEIEIIGTAVPETTQYFERCIKIHNTEWKIQNFTRDGQVFRIPYTITNGTLDNIYMDPEVRALLLKIHTTGDGTMKITAPRNLADPQFSGRDDAFIVLVNGAEIKYSEEKNRCFRTLSIPFKHGSTEIEIIAESGVMYPEIRSFSEVLAVYVTTDKNNYESEETIMISGCTNLALDYDKIILEILNPENKTYDIVTVLPNVDGTFSYSFQPQGTLGIDGNYTINASYGDNVNSHTFVVPEFPLALLLLTLSFIPIILLSKSR